MLSAGEASGDRLGAGLARALLERRPDLELVGMGGEQMAAAGVRLIQDSAAVAVVGIFDVLSHLGAIRAAMRGLERFLNEERPDLLVPIDFPDFNLRLAARAGRAGVPVVYYVSPQVWAWRPRRVHRIRRLVRRMLVLFPFETEIYERAGVPVDLVGYPVSAQPEAGPDPELWREVGLDPEREVVALLPGSRRIEVSRQLPPMLEAALLIQRKRPQVQFLLPVAPGLSADWLAEQIADAPRDLRLHSGDFPAILGLCRAGAVAAGTASLELALAGLPMVVVYRMGGLSHAIGRALVRVRHAALPNLVVGKPIVPELIQREFSPERLATELLRYLERPDEAARARGELAEVRRRLAGEDAFGRAAEAVLHELDCNGAGFQVC